MRKKGIPKPLGKDTVLFKDGDTRDIIKAVLIGDSKRSYQDQFCKWVNKEFDSSEKGLKKLWNFTKYGYTYKRDPKGKQLIKTPPALNKIGKADCKSKTLFINACLRCLGIDYLIRFTSYDKYDKTVKHVYTVALIEGEELPIDSVWIGFGTEKQYTFKKDYKGEDMTEIHLIEGLDNKRTKPTPIGGKSHKSRSYIEEERSRWQEVGIKEALEIQQRKQSLPREGLEELDLTRMTEAEANLKLLEQELQLIKWLRPEIAKEAQKALDLVTKQKKTGCICGVGAYSPMLGHYAKRLQSINQTPSRPALSYGISNKYLNYLKSQKGKPYVGTNSFPQRICPDGYLWVEKDPNGSAFRQYGGQDAQTGFCSLNGGAFSLLSNQTGWSVWDGSRSFNTPSSEIRNRLYLGYGAQTPYRVGFNEFAARAQQTLQQLLNEGVLVDERQGSYWCNTQEDFDTFIERMQAASGVRSKWLQKTFKVDKDASAHGGTSLLYGFRDEATTQTGRPINPNTLPTQVNIKGAFHDEYLGACRDFSGASLPLVKNMARLGTISDMGGRRPGDFMGWLQEGGIPNRNEIGEPLTVGAIVGIITAIVAALSSAIATVVEAVNGAEEMDMTLAKQVGFRPPTKSNGFAESDWSKSSTGGGPRDDKNNNNDLLMLGGLGLGAYLLMSE